MMKKILFVALCLWVVSCAKNENTEQELTATSEHQERHCASHSVLEQQLQQDPSLQTRMDEIERFVQEKIASGERTLLPDGSIEIPVVVNVLWKTSAQNISDAQIQSQIDVLNYDFSATNSDYGNIPSIFTGVASGDVNVSFVLSQIKRKQTNKSSWLTNDAVKKTSQGGLNPTNPTTKLNLWVCNLSGGVLGYAQFPGGNSNTDGVVIDDNAMGNMGTAAYPYNDGRTATHEVGHWLNLRHIWGDASCGNDQVSDTPKHNTANYGCPSFPHYSTCSGNPTEMTMNYMDYTYDACMYMFTVGQKNRMNAVFAAGGPRNSFAQ